MKFIINLDESMRNKRKIIYWVLLIIWMCVIFIMSNQPASISDTQSGEIIKFLSSIGINMDSIFGQLTNFIVRKCAHFLEYMILCFFTYNVLNLYFNKKRIAIFTIIFIFLYSCTDEIHQLFVAGREGAIRDVIIDTLGGVTFIIIRILIKHNFVKKIMHEKK